MQITLILPVALALAAFLVLVVYGLHATSAAPPAAPSADHKDRPTES